MQVCHCISGIVDIAKSTKHILIWTKNRNHWQILVKYRVMFVEIINNL